MTLAELRRYDVGSLKPGSKAAARYPARSPADAGIPTLAELFDALKSAGLPKRLIYIEIKTDPTRPDLAPEPSSIVDAVASEIQSAVWGGHAKIIAFDWSVLRLVKERIPGLATAHLTIPPALAATVKPLADGASPWTDGVDLRHHGGSGLAAIKAHGGEEWSPHVTDVTAERLAEAADLGLRVGPWGLSSADDIRRLVGLGVFSVTVSGPTWS